MEMCEPSNYRDNKTYALILLLSSRRCPLLVPHSDGDGDLTSFHYTITPRSSAPTCHTCAFPLGCLHMNGKQVSRVAGHCLFTATHRTRGGL